MIPSDHYVRLYNEVFKALEAKGHEHLLDYWREIGRKKIRDYGDVFRERGLETAYDLYCDHCMGWIQPLMDHVGLYAVMDMKSRTEPKCLFRVYKDRDRAEAFAAEARLLSRPYD